MQVSANGSVVCPLIRVIKVDERPLVNLKWIDDFHLLGVDVRERLLLVDVLKGVVSDTAVDGMQMVYNSADFKVPSLTPAV